MFARFKRFIEGLESGDKPNARPKDELATAVAVLLAKAAALDGPVDATERRIVADRLSARYGVAANELTEVMDEAERTAEDSVDLYHFTRVAKDLLDEAGRIELLEALWEVVYADGVLHEYEAQLMRRVSGLLFVDDRASGAARKRALDKLGLDG
jgi:uncharacterized tellurite resistance protein B-like protein